MQDLEVRNRDLPDMCYRTPGYVLSYANLGGIKLCWQCTAVSISLHGSHGIVTCSLTHVVQSARGQCGAPIARCKKRQETNRAYASVILLSSGQARTE